MTVSGRLVSAACRRSVAVRSWQTPGDTILLHGHEDWVTTAISSADEAVLVSASVDHSLRVWCLAERVPLRVLRGHQTEVRGLCWLTGADRVVSSSRDGEIRVWDAASGACLAAFRLGGEAVATVASGWREDVVVVATVNGLLVTVDIAAGVVVDVSDRPGVILVDLCVAPRQVALGDI